MRKSLRTTIAIGATLLITACSEPKIDASTQESMKQSIQKISEALPPEKQSDLKEALMVIAMSSGNILDKNYNAQTAMSDQLDGLTAEEIFKKRDQILTERKQREKKQALTEIKELKSKKEKASKAAQELAQFEVLNSRFYLEEQKYGRPKPVIALTVRNRTAYPISRVYFDGVVASPDRSIPWISETFNYTIPGGLEPGEATQWQLLPNQFSEWGTTPVPDDAILTVTTYKLEGSTGEVLFDSKFSDRDKQRLDSLLEEFGP